MGFIVPPSKYEIQHAKQIFAAQTYQSTHNGQLPDTRAWRMLESRHALNATRFDFYHPNIGRMIEGRGFTPPATQVVVKGWQGHMRGPETTPIVPIIPPVVPPVVDVVPTTPTLPPTGQEVTPPGPLAPQSVVPEPAAFLMFAVAMLTMGLFFHHARRRPR
ncbi:hypothetical protein [Paludisphaera mucosa]|uniref:PEP-CTERM protein-sorting domain-containing protein n=1 Tax=Paludisphaera mucosa TaxID=3030827 RepID=A0ABT6FKG7_9BACT|nr:hypothetical protein [Paludisphaera mucosa]MDG3008009.1 hypothetical protein [Paludisphaera mucosa]